MRQFCHPDYSLTVIASENDSMCMYLCWWSIFLFSMGGGQHMRFCFSTGRTEDEPTIPQKKKWKNSHHKEIASECYRTAKSSNNNNRYGLLMQSKIPTFLINYISSAQGERSGQGWATKLAMQERKQVMIRKYKLVACLPTSPVSNTSSVTAMGGSHLHRDWFRPMSHSAFLHPHLSWTAICKYQETKKKYRGNIWARTKI